MKTVGILKIAASTLVLGSALTPVSASNYGHEASAPEKAAAQAAQQASKLIAKRKFSAAVEKAELAVSAMPRSAEYRALLGQAYLSAGRFQSAETTLGEAAALDPSNARAALNLALAQIATGHNNRARATLDAYRDRLPASDFGLASALAGDLDEATAVLEAAVRAPDAEAKTRQNLALTYALANRWREARIMASQDLAGEALYARMTEWAAFTIPGSSSHQVASLLRVTPVADPGQPQALALAQNGETQVAVAAPVAKPAEPDAAFSAEPAPVFEIAQSGAPAAVAPAARVQISAPVEVTSAIEAPASPIAALGESRVTAQPVALPGPVAVPVIRAEPRPLKTVAIQPSQSSMVRPAQVFRPVQAGQYVVQLGAFSSAARAEAAWNGDSGRFRALDGYSAATATVRVNNASLYRLSVTGFTTRAAASQVCARIKANGGDCFVRTVAGDTPLQWASARRGTRIASRD